MKGKGTKKKRRKDATSVRETTIIGKTKLKNDKKKMGWWGEIVNTATEEMASSC